LFKVIVAGCGGISNSWIGPASKRGDCKIAALVDLDVSRAIVKRDEFALDCAVYESLAEACDKENADVVFDITPPEQHCATVTTALRMGCHVFGEKPMAENLRNAEKMVECSDETKREYFVMQNYRYNPEIAALKNFLRSGELGAIGQLSANFQLNPRFGGFRDEMESPLVLDMSIHTFDAARFLTGKDPARVYCVEFNPPWSWYKGDASAVCVFEMEDGSVFDYRGCWCATGLTTPWNSEWKAACADGVVAWDGRADLFWDGKKKPWGADPTEKNAIEIGQMENTGHAGCIEEMFVALANGKRPQTDCRDNFKSIGMVYKAIESSRSKSAVAI